MLSILQWSDFMYSQSYAAHSIGESKLIFFKKKYRLQDPTNSNATSNDFWVNLKFDMPTGRFLKKYSIIGIL